MSDEYFEIQLSYFFFIFFIVHASFVTATTCDFWVACLVVSLDFFANFTGVTLASLGVESPP